MRRREFLAALLVLVMPWRRRTFVCRVPHGAVMYRRNMTIVIKN